MKYHTVMQACISKLSNEPIHLFSFIGSVIFVFHNYEMETVSTKKMCMVIAEAELGYTQMCGSDL